MIFLGLGVQIATYCLLSFTTTQVLIPNIKFSELSAIMHCSERSQVLYVAGLTETNLSYPFIASFRFMLFRKPTMTSGSGFQLFFILNGCDLSLIVGRLKGN